MLVLSKNINGVKSDALSPACLPANKRNQTVYVIVKKSKFGANFTCDVRAFSVANVYNSCCLGDMRSMFTCLVIQVLWTNIRVPCYFIFVSMVKRKALIVIKS